MKPSEEYLLEYAAKMDGFAHEWNAEMVEKYSMLLVFAAFILGLALQLGYVSLSLGVCKGWIVLITSGSAVGLSLLAILFLLATALIGGYKMIPLPSECIEWVSAQRAFLKGNTPDIDGGKLEAQTLDDLKEQLLGVMSITVQDNIKRNEWKTSALSGASISLIIASICFGASVVMFGVKWLTP